MSKAGQKIDVTDDELKAITSRQTLPPSNEYVLDTLHFYALGDRLIIQEDEFKSGYECVKCGGTGKVESTVVKGATKVCDDCAGRGGILVVPEVSQRRPTTGHVVSAGPECKTLKSGDNVMYSNFAGYVIDLDRAGRRVTLRILHETEILCGMSGQLELRTLKGKTEIATFGN